MPTLTRATMFVSLDQVLEAAGHWLRCGRDVRALYNGLGQLKDLVEDSLSQRYAVVATALALISAMVPFTQRRQDQMIAIPLVDIKTLNALMALVVKEGVYYALEPGVGIPLGLRTKISDRDADQSQAKSMDECLQILELFCSQISPIIHSPTDVRDLLLVGTYASDLVCASAQLIQYGGQDHTSQVLGAIDTYTLYQAFTSLLRPRQSRPAWFTQFVARQLAILPTGRPDGVRCLIEFTSGLRDKEQVSLTDLDRAVQVLAAVPRDTDLQDHASHLSQQFYSILARKQFHTELTVSTVYIINQLYDSEKGKRLLAPFLARLDLNRPLDEDALSDLLHVLTVLVKSPTHALVLSLRQKLLTPLWSLLCFVHQSKRPSQIAIDLLTSFMKIDPELPALKAVVSQMLVKPVFRAGPNGGVCSDNLEHTSFPDSDFSFDLIDTRLSLFETLLQPLSESTTSQFFVSTLRHWLTGANTTLGQDPLQALVGVRVVDMLAQKFKDRLLKDPREIIEVLSTVLEEYVLTLKKGRSDLDIVHDGIIGADSDDEGDSDDEDDSDPSQMANLCLSIIASLFMDLAEIDAGLLASIEPPLRYLSLHDAKLRSKADYTLELLGAVDPSVKAETGPDNLKKALDLLQDELVPVRAHGLHLLQELVQSRDSSVSATSVLPLLLHQLQHEDSFIYLNTIRALEVVSQVYGADTVIPVVVRGYVDMSADKDSRLRMGEVLERILGSGSLPAAVTAQVVEALLSVVRERTNDQHLRMSAMSLLGVLCKVNPHGLSSAALLTDIVDCSEGILTFETTADQAEMRRAAIVLIGALAQSFDASDPSFPRRAVQAVLTRIRHVNETDQDSLVRFQAGEILEMVRI